MTKTGSNTLRNLLTSANVLQRNSTTGLTISNLAATIMMAIIADRLFHNMTLPQSITIGSHPYAPFCVPYGEAFMKDAYTNQQFREMQEDTRAIHKMIDTKMRELYPGNHNKWMDFYDPRTGKIREFLDRHTEIDSFVVLDDRNLSHGLEGHFVPVYPSKWHKPLKFSTAQTVRTLYPTF